MNADVSEMAGIATIGSISIITGSFLQSQPFIQNVSGLIQPFTFYLFAGLLLLFASATVMLSQVIGKGFSDFLDGILPYALIGGIIIFFIAVVLSLYYFLK